jgi:hypothetical protein
MYEQYDANRENRDAMNKYVEEINCFMKINYILYIIIHVMNKSDFEKTLLKWSLRR